jgi:hypothetical protein
MSDPNQHHGAGDVNTGELITVADALRALPQAAPPSGVWPQLAAQLAAQTVSPPRSRPRRWLVPAALAAGVVLACALLLRVPAPSAGGNLTATNPATAASYVHNAANDTNTERPKPAAEENLAALQSRSHVLERWLRDTGAASAPKSAQDLAASAEIEDMIGLVDVQLAAPDATNDSAALSLWRRRVALLEDLSMLRYGANVMQFKTGLAAAGIVPDGTGATPVTWSN